jgi:hypothetical protein
MNDKIIAVMGYPDKPNKYRFNSNRTSSTKSNSKNKREKQ